MATIKTKYSIDDELAVIAEAIKGNMVTGKVTKIETETTEEGDKIVYHLGTGKSRKNHFNENHLVTYEEGKQMVTDFLVKRLTEIRDGKRDRTF